MSAPPVFIYGCPRSGTSLLSRIVSAHSRIAIPFESHIYHYLWSMRHLFGSLDDRRAQQRLIEDILGMEDLKQWDPPPSAERALAAVRRPGFHGIFEAILQSWADDRGKPRWGEKTPQHTLSWRIMLEAFPEQRVLHLVRDGRDVALSYKQAFFGPKHMFHIARRWQRFLSEAEAAGDALGPGAFLRVRYEDLLAEPERTVRGVCDFLGEAYEPRMLAAHESKVRYDTDARNLRALQQPILSDNTGKWRSGMSARDLRIFEAVAGDALDRYGYERGLAGASVSALEVFSFRFLENPPVKALALLGNRKSQRITLQRLALHARWRLGLGGRSRRPQAAR